MARQIIILTRSDGRLLWIAADVVESFEDGGFTGHPGKTLITAGAATHVVNEAPELIKRLIEG